MFAMSPILAFCYYRVTRLGENSPIGQLFTLSSFFKITKVDVEVGATFVQEKSYVLLMMYNGLGYFWGGFFTHPSGHPASTECG
jgi:hypothetical protein